MKITFLTAPLHFSGGAHVTKLHAAMLRDRGHEVELVFAPPKKPSWKQQLQAIKHGQFSQLFNRAPKITPDDLNLNYRMLETSRPVMNEDVPDADVIIATWWETAEWVAKLSPSKGTKVYFIQGHEVYDYLPIERAKATYRSSLYKIAVSDWLQELMITEYCNDNCEVVPNAVDLNRFQMIEREKKSPLTVGFLYTQLPVKSVHIAIEAVTKAREIIPDLRVLSFGREKPNKNLLLPSWVEFQYNPPQNEIPHIYGNCDIWLFSTQMEGFGLPIVEALACGTPVISTSAGAAPQLVNDQTGALVETTPDAFVEQIIRFSKMNNEEWRQISKNAHRRASNYTWQDASLLFETALRNAIQKSTVQ